MSRSVWCRHYSGRAYGSTCDCGVEYDSVCSGSKFPCCNSEDARLCDRHEHWTQEEIEEEEREIASYVLHSNKIAKEVSALVKKGMKSGVLACPKCQGKLQWERPYRRLYVECEVNDCLKFEGTLT